MYLVSLGCPKNLVDSELMLGLLQQDGFSISQDPEAADLLLINTCGFIGSAVEEAIDEILALAEYKKQDPEKILVVTGCLVQRYGKKIQKELPEVDLFIGTDGFQHIVRLLRERQPAADSCLTLPAPSFLMNSSHPRQVSTPAHRAYLKITEGCDNRCSYCLIPAIRGRMRSRTVSDLLTETRRLADNGVKELTLVAQDLLAYGLDLDGRANIMSLLESLLAGCNIPWLRLLYLNPARMKPDLLSFMAANPRILPYMDLPIQHVNDRILKLMNRPYGRADLDRLLKTIRQTMPDAALRTTLMVGFPGETVDDFAEMAEFVRAAGFDHLGVFTYSKEEGSRAAALPGQCSEAEKKKRCRRLMELQADISLAKLRRFLGKTEKVLVEGVSRESDILLEGRTRYQAADVDGCVYINAGITMPGEIVDVRITDAHTYDLVGEIVESS